jgi:FlaG/FlaF family flagellin (archaellin)
MEISLPSTSKENKKGATLLNLNLSLTDSFEGPPILPQFENRVGPVHVEWLDDPVGCRPRLFPAYVPGTVNLVTSGNFTRLTCGNVSDVWPPPMPTVTPPLDLQMWFPLAWIANSSMQDVTLSPRDLRLFEHLTWQFLGSANITSVDSSRNTEWSSFFAELYPTFLSVTHQKSASRDELLTLEPEFRVDDVFVFRLFEAAGANVSVNNATNPASSVAVTNRTASSSHWLVLDVRVGLSPFSVSDELVEQYLQIWRDSWEVYKALLQWGLPDRNDVLFSGVSINITENVTDGNRGDPKSGNSRGSNQSGDDDVWLVLGGAASVIFVAITVAFAYLYRRMLYSKHLTISANSRKRDTRSNASSSKRSGEQNDLSFRLDQFYDLELREVEGDSYLSDSYELCDSSISSRSVASGSSFRERIMCAIAKTIQSETLPNPVQVCGSPTLSSNPCDQNEAKRDLNYVDGFEGSAKKAGPDDDTSVYSVKSSFTSVPTFPAVTKLLHSAEKNVEHDSGSDRSFLPGILKPVQWSTKRSLPEVLRCITGAPCATREVSEIHAAGEDVVEETTPNDSNNMPGGCNAGKHKEARLDHGIHQGWSCFTKQLPDDHKSTTLVAGTYSLCQIKSIS